MRPTILLTGARGQLGTALAVALVPHGEVVATDRSTLDLADASAVADAVRRVRPALIVNAGA
ncbi:MAG: sugar nucleotide-binding protein, partial [Burkholderiales bacterium]|nr:sugar nucleotide-binding protein [Burkholderiales bacterium]